MLSARGFRGVINAVLLGYFQGSLGVDLTVSGDETFVGNETTLMNAFMQESMDSDDHLIADNTTLLINMASLIVTGKYTSQSAIESLFERFISSHKNKIITRLSRDDLLDTPVILYYTSVAEDKLL